MKSRNGRNIVSASAIIDSCIESDELAKLDQQINWGDVYAQIFCGYGRRISGFYDAFCQGESFLKAAERFNIDVDYAYEIAQSPIWEKWRQRRRRKLTKKATAKTQ
jgi:hypothetical protein